MKHNKIFSFTFFLLLVLFAFSLTACLGGFTDLKTTYEVTFDGNGGALISGDLSQSVEYGESATPPVFEKEGYSLSWNKPFVYVTSNLDVSAVWTLRNFEISFETNGGTDINPLLVPYGSEKAFSNVPEKEHSDFLGWFYDALLETPVESSVSNEEVFFFVPSMPARDLVLYAKWVPLYSVSFDSKGGSNVDSIYVRKGSLIPAPEKDPTRGNFAFEGWFLDEECLNAIDFGTYVMGDAPITLFAKWETAFAVVFNSMGGSNVETIYVKEGDLIPAPAEDPTRENFLFDGWFLDEDCLNAIDFSTYEMGDSPITLFAKWEPLYSVSFDSRGGSEVETIYVKEGDLIPAPAEDPTRENFIFEGWFLDEYCLNLIDFSTYVMGAAPITLFAKWIES